MWKTKYIREKESQKEDYTIITQWTEIFTLQLQQHVDRSFQSHQGCLWQNLHKYAISINLDVNQVIPLARMVSAWMYLRTAASCSNLRNRWELPGVAGTSHEYLSWKGKQDKPLQDMKHKNYLTISTNKSVAFLLVHVIIKLKITQMVSYWLGSVGSMFDECCDNEIMAITGSNVKGSVSALVFTVNINSCAQINKNTIMNDFFYLKCMSKLKIYH